MKFAFDDVIGSGVCQEELFKRIGQKTIKDGIMGHNGTIFVYGQTGSGKTHTMTGDLNSKENKGILPRALEYLFYSLDQNEIDYEVKISFLEIYNEKIRDLLVKENKKNLQIRENTKNGVWVDGLEKIVVRNWAETEKYILTGNNARTVGETGMNSQSSRSHTVFTVELSLSEINSKEGGVIRKHSKLNFVDLAGSERQKQAMTVDTRLKEGCSITKSLSVLGSVISSATSGSFPKRDSSTIFL